MTDDAMDDILDELLKQYSPEVYLMYRMPNGEILVTLRLHPMAVRGVLTIAETGKEFTMEILASDQKVTATVAWLDAKGNPAKVDGIPVWAESGGGVVTLAPAADGMSCEIAADQIGTAQVSCTGDADLGEGTRSVVVTGDVQVVAGEAVSGSMTFGPPEPQE